MIWMVNYTIAQDWRLCSGFLRNHISVFFAAFLAALAVVKVRVPAQSDVFTA